MNRTRLLLPILVVIAAVVAVVVSTSSGSSQKPQPAVAANSAISLKQTSVGQVLVDANGRTLYLFAGDKPDVSTLSAAGRAVWPPLTSATAPTAGADVSAAQIGRVTGTSAGAQITYNGHPLYYFVGDQKPGQTKGQGLNEFGGLWYALSATGAAITSAPHSAAPPAPTGSGSGSNYGY